MLKIITLIVFIALTQILAQGSIDTLRSNDKKVQEALNYYNQKNYEKAKAMLEKIIDSNEKNAEAHYSLAYTLFRLKNLDGARLLLANFYFQAPGIFGGSYDKAIEKYKKTVSLAPNKSWTHNLLGNAYLLKGKYDEAIVEFNIALTINPNSEYAKGKLEETNEKRTNK